ncbi:hypothetical protein BRADI_2g21924v3 [Brachypodium distachyon]|uniref:Uncharacterized protein n=1 Tax=Brachypodium distachyon TaxID=15368 RepID=A0A2K2D9S0_BRADI|nr:hypothetical protein BRADI_2g21924v3 [Brachypodium distachyon]
MQRKLQQTFWGRGTQTKLDPGSMMGEKTVSSPNSWLSCGYCWW